MERERRMSGDHNNFEKERLEVNYAAHASVPHLRINKIASSRGGTKSQRSML